MSSSTIVITGASGFIGQNLVKYFIKEGINVIAVSRKKFPGYLQVKDYSETPKGDVLIHLAQCNDRNKVNTLNNSFEESDEVMNILLSKNYERIVYASSAVLYNDRVSCLHKSTDDILLSKA